MHVYNPTGSPVVIDSKGHTLGGRERADVDENPAVRRAIETGQLIPVEQQDKPKTASRGEKG